jgi:predicted lipid-binding transport protein (Tim44 family)
VQTQEDLLSAIGWLSSSRMMRGFKGSRTLLRGRLAIALIGMAISSASFCSSTVHSRERAMMDPPQPSRK